MTLLSRVKEVFINGGMRIIKVLRLGRDDVQEADQSSPFGVDSSPLSDMTAVYADTGIMGEPVIVGYINEQQLAEKGETRLYSVDSGGNLKTYIWLKNNGTIELGGSAHNAVRYAPLNTGLQNYNTAITAELALISMAITNLGGAYDPGILTIDISASKIDELKTS